MSDSLFQTSASLHVHVHAPEGHLRDIMEPANSLRHFATFSSLYNQSTHHTWPLHLMSLTFLAHPLPVPYYSHHLYASSFIHPHLILQLCTSSPCIPSRHSCTVSQPLIDCQQETRFEPLPTACLPFPSFLVPCFVTPYKQLNRLKGK